MPKKAAPKVVEPEPAVEAVKKPARGKAAVVAEPEVPAVAPKKVRGKQAEAQPEPVEQPVEIKKTARGKKAAEPVVEAVEEKPVETKKGRGKSVATVEPVVESVVEPVAEVKKGARGKKVAAVAEPEPVVETAPVVVEEPAKATKGRKRAAEDEPAPSKKSKTEDTLSSNSKSFVPLTILAPSGSWNCTNCLISNKADLTKCAACEELRVKPAAGAAAPVSQPAPISNFFAAAAPGSWNCKVCLIRNQPDAQKCAACEALRDGSSAPQPTATGFSIPTSNGAGFTSSATAFGSNTAGATQFFSFFPPGQTNNTTAPAAPATGFTFVAPPAAAAGTATGFTFKP